MTDGARDLELRRGLGEGKETRSKPRGDIGAKERAGEGLDHAREIGERDTAIHDEPFDLVERRQMAGVGRVTSKTATGHDRVHRERIRSHGVFHEVDLSGGRVRAQHDRLGVTEFDVERVPQTASRMRWVGY